MARCIPSSWRGTTTPPRIYINRKIVEAKLLIEDTEKLRLSFEDGSVIDISDIGQSCCESRYICCDDEIQQLVGHKLTYIQVKEVDDLGSDQDDCHEIAFVEIGTDDGSITLVTHNEHNGYYGGFMLEIDEVDSVA